MTGVDSTTMGVHTAVGDVSEAGAFSRFLDSVSLFFLELFGGDPLAV